MDLSSAAIVVAHPDDEILWFSSIVSKVSLIIMCYGAVEARPERGQQRRNTIRNYPLSTVKFLDLPEPGNVSATLDNQAQLALVELLKIGLTGMKTVFTHNKWGEYGHIDHRRVNAAVRALQSEAKFELYVSSYIGRAAVSSFEDEFSDIVSFPIDQTSIEPIYSLYKANSCWTWAQNWSWPEQEHFFHVGQHASYLSKSLPVRLIC